MNATTQPRPHQASPAALYVNLAGPRGRMAIAMHPRLWARLAVRGGRSAEFIDAVVTLATERWEADAAVELAAVLDADTPRRGPGRPLGAKSANPNAHGAGWQSTARGDDWLQAAREDLAAIYGEDNGSARDGLGHAAEHLAATPAALSPATAPGASATPTAPVPAPGAVEAVAAANDVAPGDIVGALVIVAPQPETRDVAARARGRAPTPPSRAAAGPIQLAMPWATPPAHRAHASLDPRRSRAGPDAATHRAAA